MVKQYAKGMSDDDLSRRENSDLWEELRGNLQAHGHQLEFVWVNSHPVEAMEVNQLLPLFAYALNDEADVMAIKGARLHEVNEADASKLERDITTASDLLLRFATIAADYRREGDEHLRRPEPVLRPRLAALVAQLMEQTSHACVVLRGGGLHCESCLARCAPSLSAQRKFLNSRCGHEELVKPHASHRLVASPVSLVWCAKCGSWSSGR